MSFSVESVSKKVSQSKTSDKHRSTQETKSIYYKFSDHSPVINSNVFVDLDIAKIEESKKVIVVFAFRILVNFCWIQNANERLLKCIQLCDKGATSAKQLLHETSKTITKMNDIDLIYVELQDTCDKLLQHSGASRARTYLGYYIVDEKPLISSASHGGSVNLNAMAQALFKLVKQNSNDVFSDVGSNPPDTSLDLEMTNSCQKENYVDDMQVDTSDMVNAFVEKKADPEEKDVCQTSLLPVHQHFVFKCSLLLHPCHHKIH